MTIVPVLGLKGTAGVSPTVPCVAACWIATHVITSLYTVCASQNPMSRVLGLFFNDFLDPLDNFAEGRYSIEESR